MVPDTSLLSAKHLRIDLALFSKISFNHIMVSILIESNYYK